MSCLYALLLSGVYLQAQVLVSADEPPVFEGCEDQGPDRKSCSDVELQFYLADNMEYPQAALAQRMEGTVIATFVVDTQGYAVTPRILYNPGYGCGEEARRLIVQMPRWSPARHEGRKVAYLVQVEVPFVLPTSYHTAAPSTDPSPAQAVGNTARPYYTTADRMPIFDGCDLYEHNYTQRQECSNALLLRYLRDSIQYPAAARLTKTEGIVYARFVVDTDGRIVNPEIVRDIGGGCGEETLRVLSSMPDWMPGTIGGTPVPVQLQLPVHFYLQSQATEQTSGYKLTWAGLIGDRVTPDELIQALQSPVMVRDAHGNEVTLSTLEVHYLRRRRHRTAASTGLWTSDMSTIISRTRSGGLLTIVATVLYEGELIELERTFEIVK